uniref:Uncharacterized protein n=1 Tax=Pristionchus pacificus TaxID=54126 RepID=A0A2A6B9E7_PRIPA|eukprot:PDM62483.1 hypothetical protein PRIPAC_51925 [Pristionchus pacificus]
MPTLVLASDSLQQLPSSPDVILGLDGELKKDQRSKINLEHSQNQRSPYLQDDLALLALDQYLSVQNENRRWLLAHAGAPLGLLVLEHTVIYRPYTACGVCAVLKLDELVLLENVPARVVRVEQGVADHATDLGIRGRYEKLPYLIELLLLHVKSIEDRRLQLEQLADRATRDLAIKCSSSCAKKATTVEFKIKDQRSNLANRVGFIARDADALDTDVNLQTHLAASWRMEEWMRGVL